MYNTKYRYKYMYMYIIELVWNISRDSFRGKIAGMVDVTLDIGQLWNPPWNSPGMVDTLIPFKVHSGNQTWQWKMHIV